MPFAVTQEHEYENTVDEEFFIMKCLDCGLLYLNPQPDISEFDRIYPKDYICHTDTAKMDKETMIGRFKMNLSKLLGPERAVKKYWTL